MITTLGFTVIQGGSFCQTSEPVKTDITSSVVFMNKSKSITTSSVYVLEVLEIADNKHLEDRKALICSYLVNCCKHQLVVLE